MNTFEVLKYGLRLTADGYRQLAFINSFLKPIVTANCRKTGYQLSASEKKKVLFYYPMYTILGCAQMYTALRGRDVTMDERRRLTLVGAWATLCDDLVDDHNWSHDEVLHIVFNNPKNESLPGNAKLLVTLIQKLRQLWHPTDKYIQQLNIALEWQSTSAHQFDPNISLDEIVRICREKNGNTSLMFATLLDEEWTEKELAFIYQSAIVGQLTNDSFDIYKDTQSGIYTYFNKASSITQVREFFLDECRKLHSLVRACNTSEKNKKNTIHRMCILHAFTLTALDHLQKTEDKLGAPVDWKKVSRQDMVTDMAINSNRFKTISYMKWLAKQ